MILQIEKKWFNMILSGEKKEEYLEIKRYYRSRLYSLGLIDRYGLPLIGTADIEFRNGYSTGSPSFTATVSCDIKPGKEEWGAEPGVEYFVLKIEKIGEK